MPKKIHIVHVIESASGGSLEYVKSIVNSLPVPYFQSTVIFSRRGDTPPDLGAHFRNHVTLIETKMCRDISLLLDIRGIYRLRKLFIKLSPDVIHLHSSKAGALGRIAGLMLPATRVYTPHGYSFYRTDISPAERWIYRFVERFLARTCKAITLVSSPTELESIRSLAPDTSSVLIANSVPIPKCVYKYGPDLTCVTVGRLTAAKNPDAFVQIAHRVVQLHPDVRFVWVGDGELREQVTKHATQLGVNLEITGWIERDRVFEILGKSRVYIQTSEWEAAPLSVLEAMACAKPVVLSDIPAHRDIAAGGKGVYLASNLDEFTHHLLALISDEDLCEKIGWSARNQVLDKYDLKVFMRNIARFYVTSE